MQLAVWPPDYPVEWKQRNQRVQRLRTDAQMRANLKAFYKTRPIEFIEHWCVVHEPRNAGSDRPTLMPFILFQKQRDLIEFFHACLLGQANGLVEKSRDMGATWLGAAFCLDVVAEREAGVEWVPGLGVEKNKINVLVMDWRDHPEKTEDWYKNARQPFVDAGTLHLWAQECPAARNMDPRSASNPDPSIA